MRSCDPHVTGMPSPPMQEGGYSNCSCASQTNGSFSQVAGGRCPNDCFYLPVLLIVLLLFFITVFAGEIPGLLVVMR